MLDRRLPSFVVIGAMKAGTTSLHANLSVHPELGMPSSRKELNFFNVDANWEQGLDWYRAHFPDDDTVKGEVNPNYSISGNPITVERMAEALPRAKLVYIVRDPIARLLSHVQHLKIGDREPRAIDEILSDPDDRGHYVGCSCYHQRLSVFLERYPLENVLVVALEDLASDPGHVMGEVFRFVGVDPGFDHPVFARAHNASSTRLRRGRLQMGLSRFSRRLPRPLRRRFWKRLGRPVPRPALTEAQHAWLVERFTPEVAALRELTGREFLRWEL